MYGPIALLTVNVTERQPEVKFDVKFDNDPDTEGVQTDFLYRVSWLATGHWGLLWPARDA